MVNLKQYIDKNNKAFTVGALVVIVALVLVIAFTELAIHNKNKPATQAKTNTTNVTYNFGKQVPTTSQARAKALGYYCPSWDKKGASAICYKLD